MYFPGRCNTRRAGRNVTSIEEITQNTDFDQGAKRAQWYAVRTRSSSERMVADGFTARDIEHYLPMQQRTCWTVDRRCRITEAPMLTGYLFCRLEERRFTPVLETPGVVQVVGTGRFPECIPDREVEAIRALSRQGPAAQVLPHLCVGQRVRIHTFGLDGFEGVILRIDGREMVAVNVNLLGRSVAIDVAANELEIVKCGPLAPSLRSATPANRVVPNLEMAMAW